MSARHVLPRAAVLSLLASAVGAVSEQNQWHAGGPEFRYQSLNGDVRINRRKP